MNSSPSVARSVNEYFKTLSGDTLKKMQQVRQVIREAAPEAEEKISYAIPTFYLHGNLVHFAAFKNHIGFYPGSSGIQAFDEELTSYKRAAGSVQFPLSEPMPINLIKKIVRYRVKENMEAAKQKKKKIS